jgi:L1 cell adhesion molecule like protein
MQAAEDFLQLILEAHVVASVKAAKEDGMAMTDLANKIAENYVYLSCHNSTSVKDQVHTYASKVLTLALSWQNYYDATKEGDGKRILSLWKYLLLVFKKLISEIMLRKLQLR